MNETDWAIMQESTYKDRTFWHWRSSSAGTQPLWQAETLEVEPSYLCSCFLHDRSITPPLSQVCDAPLSLYSIESWMLCFDSAYAICICMLANWKLAMTMWKCSGMHRGRTTGEFGKFLAVNILLIDIWHACLNETFLYGPFYLPEHVLVHVCVYCLLTCSVYQYSLLLYAQCYPMSKQSRLAAATVFQQWNSQPLQSVCGEP